MANNNNLEPARSSWLTLTNAGLCVLTLNSILAVHRATARADAAAVLFVLGAYLALLLLLASLRAHERAPPGSPSQRRARRVVWTLTTLITAGFAWKVAAAVPSPVLAGGVWGLAVATSVGGFYALFVHA